MLCAHVNLVPHVCLVTTKARRGHQSHWNYSYRWLWTVMLVLAIKPLEEQSALLNKKPSLQALTSCLKGFSGYFCWLFNSQFLGLLLLALTISFLLFLSILCFCSCCLLNCNSVNEYVSSCHLSSYRCEGKRSSLTISFGENVE